MRTEWSRRLRGVAIPSAASVLAVGLVVATYPRISYTFDEPAHIAAGMEWLDQGTYTYEEQHPPLGRVPLAIGPYLLGSRSHGYENIWDEGRAIFQDSPAPVDRVVAASRAGVLPFLILAIFLTWWLGSIAFSPAAGGVAAFLLALQPVFLGHAGIATTDFIGAATLLVAAFFIIRWLRQPSVKNAAWLGAGVAVALMGKMSAILFVPVTFAAAALPVLLSTPSRRAFFDSARGRMIRMIVATVAATFVVIWAGYRFSFGQIVDPADMPYEALDAIVGAQGTLHDVAYRVVSAPVPAFEFLIGVRQLFEHNASGRKSYLLGEVGSSGWPHFFTVALLVKTPIPFLLLMLGGYVAAIGQLRKKYRWEICAIALIPLFILASAIPARINAGFRYAIGVYPFFAIMAGAGAIALSGWLKQRRVGMALVAILLAVQLGGVLLAFPDFIAYFSQPFAKNKQEYLVSSDLVYGQDLYRLRSELQRQQVDTIHLLLGNNLPSERMRELGLPPIKWLRPYEPVAGWVAVDWFTLKIGPNSDYRVPSDGYHWLLAHEPVNEVGAGTLLYRFEQAPGLPPSLVASRDRWVAGESSGEFTDPDHMTSWRGRRACPPRC